MSLVVCSIGTHRVSDPEENLEPLLEENSWAKSGKKGPAFAIAFKGESLCWK